eukprot:5621772-Amphidinium_carterae.1
MMLPLELHLVAFLHLWFYLSAAHFHDRHVTRNSMRMRHPPRKAGFGLGHHASSRVYGFWIVVCVLTSVWAQEKTSIEWSLENTFHGPLLNSLDSLASAVKAAFLHY